MKKRIISLCLILALALGLSAAQAENVQVTEPELYQVTPIESGAACDLNGDGVQEAITYVIDNDDQVSIPSVQLKVGDLEAKVEGWYLHDTLFLLKMNTQTYLLVFDYGPSDDPETHFLYLNEQGELCDAGSIYADPRTMTIENEIITAQGVRGMLMYTWYHEADYLLAPSILEGAPERTVAALPRPFYPMGLTVKAQRDIPLQKSPLNSDTACTIAEGELVVLSGTDDVEWVYLARPDGSEGGWLRMSDSINALVNGEAVPAYDLLDGLVMAD